MVTTFLTEIPQRVGGSWSFRNSAKHFDDKRLGNQRREAWQLYKTVRRLEYARKLFRTNNTLNITRRIKTAQNRGYFFMWKEERGAWYRTYNKPIVLGFADKWSRDGHHILYKDQKYKESEICLPKDILLTGGYMSHPATTMWIGYSDALLAYLCDHIDEWIDRGRANTMKIDRPQNFDLPAWCQDIDVIVSHRGRLCEKLPDHYLTIWPDVAPRNNYIWPE
jgi:hypothetical protein